MEEQRDMVTTVVLGPVVPVRGRQVSGWPWLHMLPRVPGVFLNTLLASDPTTAFNLRGATGAVTRPALVQEDGHLCS